MLFSQTSLVVAIVSYGSSKSYVRKLIREPRRTTTVDNQLQWGKLLPQTKSRRSARTADLHVVSHCPRMRFLC
ncbi:MAG: hypothetical protein DWI22_09515 [Planctomycetota bacterium]|nr:MAG: hypothetical protein DWI22_09515 [Planctomycetota bacterium]